MKTINESVKVEFKIPQVPSFILAAEKDGNSVPIEKFSNAALRRIGAEWTKALIDKAIQKRVKGR